jgi:PilZ domain
VSTSAPQFTGQTQIHERRSHARLLPRALIYVACGASNGGMVLNVSDDGMAISMAIPVGDEAYSNLHVRMNGLAQSVEVHGRMAWTSKSKKRAGIQLVDISDEQRGQIREWLAQEGVRDINLLPRVSEPAASIWPAFAGGEINPALRDEQRPHILPVAASVAINPAVLAEPHASLLAGLGSTAPEFLGPEQEEPGTADTIAETRSYQGSTNFAGFRENEWDLASVTMVPRKRSKPEGLSALGLLLLWIAIPSFGIGIIVGRRPLQQWLSRGAAAGKSISHRATSGPEIVSARDGSPDITSSDIDATDTQSIPGRSVETPATKSSQNVKSSDATKSFVSTPVFVDTQLLNSMSTQELLALKAPASRAAANPNANEAKVSSKTEPNADVAKDSFSSPAAVSKLATRSNTFAASTNAPTNAVKASAQRGDSKDKPVVARDTASSAANNEAPLVQGLSKQNPSDRVARTTSVDSGANAGTASYSGVAASNVAASHSWPLSVTPAAVPHTASSSSVSSTPAMEYSTTRQSTAGSTAGIQAAGDPPSASTQSANHSVTALPGTAGNSAAASSPVDDASHNSYAALTASRTQPASASSSMATRSGSNSPRAESSRIAADATPRLAPNVRPNMTSTTTASTTAVPSFYGSSASRSAAPRAATNLAPVNAQSPLHGVMLVARKHNESFLLKLPVEAVASGRSVSIEMQRFVMMPAESRWHRHGPIAKLTIGELLTQVAPNQAGAASNARPGEAVTVRAFVDKNGTIEDLKPVSGRFALMPRVMHDVREWQFDQTLIDGKPVESEVNITVEFGSGPQVSRSREIQAQNSFKP